MRSSNRLSRWRSPGLACSALAVVLATTAWAGGGATTPVEPTSPFVPARSSANTISVRDAVAIALRHDPALFIAREASLQNKALWQQQTGSFDSDITFGTTFEQDTSAVSTSMLKNQTENRKILRDLSLRLQDVADGLYLQLLASGVAVGADCGEGVDITLPDGSSICFSGRAKAEAQLAIDTSRSLGKDELAQSLEDFFRRRSEQILDTLRLTAYATRTILRDTGVLPTLEDRTTLSFNLGLQKLYRNGTSFGPQVQLQGSRDNFRGKVLNPGFGGLGVLNSFSSYAGVQLTVPLAQGSGVASADAPEQAAKLNFEASLDTQAYSASQTVQQTLLAYWNLAAAQETLALLERSAATEEKLVGIGKALVDADEIAPADLVSVQARLASTQGSVVQARQNVLKARLALANAIGLVVDRVEDAPLASDPLPARPDQAAVDQWERDKQAQSAIANRADIRSVKKLEDSARVLAEASRLNLRRKVDLQFLCYYSGLYEGNEGKDWSSLLLQDYLRSLTYRGVGPSAQITLNISIPFENNVARGRYVQSRALVQTSYIKSRDLERTTDDRVEQLTGALRKALDELSGWEASTGYYRQILESETEKFKLGEGTVVDIVLTEDSQISAELSLVTARQKVATLVAQLRFELGDLLTYRIDKGELVIEDVRPLVAGSVSHPGA